MAMFNSVLAFGDSSVTGCELFHPIEKFYSREYMTGQVTLAELDAPGKLMSFPQMVADHFNVPCYNYGMTGSSNNRSLRLLTQAVQDHPNSLVLFAYGPTNRTEFYHPEGGLGCDEDNFFQTGPNNFDLHINRQFLEIVHPYNNLKEIMTCVDAICRLHAKDFLHLHLFTIDNEDEVPIMPKMFDWKNPRQNAEIWGMERGFPKHKFHYGVEYHRQFADEIIEIVKNNNV